MMPNDPLIFIINCFTFFCEIIISLSVFVAQNIFDNIITGLDIGRYMSTPDFHQVEIDDVITEVVLITSCQQLDLAILFTSEYVNVYFPKTIFFTF